MIAELSLNVQIMLQLNKKTNTRNSWVCKTLFRRYMATQKIIPVACFIKVWQGCLTETLINISLTWCSPVCYSPFSVIYNCTALIIQATHLYRLYFFPAKVLVTYSFSRLDGVGDAELVVGDDPEGVAGRGDQVLVGEGVLLDGAALCPRLRLPFVFVWNVSSGKKVIKDRSRLVLIGSCINIKQWAAFLNKKK